MTQNQHYLQISPAKTLGDGLNDSLLLTLNNAAIPIVSQAKNLTIRLDTLITIATCLNKPVHKKRFYMQIDTIIILKLRKK